MNTDLDVSRHYSRRNLRDRVNAPFGGGVYFGPTCGFGFVQQFRPCSATLWVIWPAGARSRCRYCSLLQG
jgi:hypothetical protein